MDRRGFTLLEVVLASALIGILMWGFSTAVLANVRILNNAIKKAQAVLDEIKSETSDIPKYCETGDSGCECKKPAICAHSFTNGKTVQACTGDCTKTAGQWFKGSQICDVAMVCTK